MGDLDIGLAPRDAVQELLFALREIRQLPPDAVPIGSSALRKSLSSVRKIVHAFSCGSRMWFLLSSGTKRAFGIIAARRRPDSKGTMASPRTWKTRVGTVIFGASLRISNAWKAFHSRQAVSDEALRRCSSPIHLICSLPPSGMRRLAKTSRNALASRPHPSSII